MIRSRPLCLGVKAITTDGSLNQITVTEPCDASPVDSESLIELVKILIGIGLLINILIMQEHRGDISVFHMMEEGLFFQVHAFLRLVAGVHALAGVVHVVLESVIGRVGGVGTHRDVALFLFLVVA